MSSKWILVIAAFFIVGFIACTHEPVGDPFEEENEMDGPGGDPGQQSGNDMSEPDTIMLGIPCHPDTVYFQSEILPILRSSCALSSCHDNNSARDGIILVDYQTLMSSDIVKPYKAEDSDLIEVLIEDDPDDIMPRPPADPLNPGQIEIIRNWINQGALNLTCDQDMMECDLALASFSAYVEPLIDDYCKGCHSGANPSGGIQLVGYENILGYVNDGRLIGAMNHDPGYIPMPQGGDRLADCKLEIIKKWIDNGAQND